MSHNEAVEQCPKGICSNSWFSRSVAEGESGVPAQLPRSPRSEAEGRTKRVTCRAKVIARKAAALLAVRLTQWLGSKF